MVIMNDFDYILTRIETARGYEEYIPEEGEEPYMEQPENEKFNRVLDSIERDVKSLKAEYSDE